MKTTKGDLIELALRKEFDVIVHGCNCFCTMGAGIAKLIKREFPAAYNADLSTPKGAREKLGTISSVKIEMDNAILIVVNGYTQYDWRGGGSKIDYNALRKVFKTIKSNYSGLRIGYPAIGAGLAGGDWKMISVIIEEELMGEDHTFVEFT